MPKIIAILPADLSIYVAVIQRGKAIRCAQIVQYMENIRQPLDTYPMMMPSCSFGRILYPMA